MRILTFATRYRTSVSIKYSGSILLFKIKIVCLLQLDTGGAMALSFDISPTNNFIAFGDEHSNISLYCNSGDQAQSMKARFVVLPVSHPLVNPECVNPDPDMDLDPAFQVIPDTTKSFL
jgi:hypothetical protein